MLMANAYFAPPAWIRIYDVDVMDFQVPGFLDLRPQTLFPHVAHRVRLKHFTVTEPYVPMSTSTRLHLDILALARASDASLGR